MKHPVDIDDHALEDAKRHWGTSTIKGTVNAALRMASGCSRSDSGAAAMTEALGTLAAFWLDDRPAAWR